MSEELLRPGDRVRLSWLGLARVVYCGSSPRPVRGTVTEVEAANGGVFVQLDGLERPGYFVGSDWELAPEGRAA